ncbi:hypothetical protein D3C72_789110 [compost metagenome]
MSASDGGRRPDPLSMQPDLGFGRRSAPRPAPERQRAMAERLLRAAGRRAEAGRDAPRSARRRRGAKRPAPWSLQRAYPSRCRSSAATKARSGSEPEPGPDPGPVRHLTRAPARRSAAACRLRRPAAEPAREVARTQRGFRRTPPVRLPQPPPPGRSAEERARSAGGAARRARDRRRRLRKRCRRPPAALPEPTRSPRPAYWKTERQRRPVPRKDLRPPPFPRMRRGRRPGRSERSGT